MKELGGFEILRVLSLCSVDLSGARASTIVSEILRYAQDDMLASVLISSSIHDRIRVRQVLFPRGEDLHRAGFELGDLGLRVERIIGQ